MAQYEQIEGAANLIRDSSNRAVLNTDIKEVEAYRSRRKLALKREQTMQGVIEDINSVKGELQDIKLLLSQLIENRS
jgi:AmiR/NasT family two-component response regulator